MNAGQICFATKRVYVPDSMLAAFVEALVNLANASRLGAGLESTTTLGPVQNKAQYDKVRAFIDEAREHGTVISGQQTVPVQGYFIAPTIVTGLADDARLVREEQFGPVLPVLGYSNVEDMIRRVNDSDYGLGASVWTSNTQRGIAVASRIDSGTVWVNGHLHLPFDIPFGGAKQSGIGQQGGIEGMKDFTQVRVVNVALG
jgi:acyl-CoA reductase-like NAD-dependent aldehyde dehydrogenase